MDRSRSRSGRVWGRGVSGWPVAIMIPIAVAGGLSVAPCAGVAAETGAGEFLRGDANTSGEIDVSDAIFVLGYLFTGGPPPRCAAVADANASGEVDISDAVTILTYLFVERIDLAPIGEVDAGLCREGPVEVLRIGDFVTLAHGVSGHVEHLSNGTIVLRDFHYDGEGLPEVYVWLHIDRTRERQGVPISDDLRRAWPYEGETLTFRLLRGMTGDDFGYVSIWCTSFPENYGYARLFRPRR